MQLVQKRKKAKMKKEVKREVSLEELSRYYEEYRKKLGFCIAKHEAEKPICILSPKDAEKMQCRYLDTSYNCRHKDREYYGCSYRCKYDL